MSPEVRLKFVAFLEVGTELNLVGKKKCTLRQNASKQGVRNTPEKKMAYGRTRAERRESKKIARCHLVNKVYVALLKKWHPSRWPYEG